MFNISVQHMQAIYGQLDACYWDTMQQEIARILYVQYHMDMVTHGTALDKSYSLWHVLERSSSM